MSMGVPSKPAKTDAFSDGVCVLTMMESVTATDRTSSVQAVGTLSNIPYKLTQMTSGEAIRFGKPSAVGLYNLMIPVRKMDDTADITVNIEDAFLIDSVKYAVFGTPIQQGTASKQLVPVQREDV